MSIGAKQLFFLLKVTATARFYQYDGDIYVWVEWGVNVAFFNNSLHGRITLNAV